MARGGLDTGLNPVAFLHASTVYYEDPSMEGTAKDIASKLGIDNVRQENGLGNPDIVVVLR